MSHPNYRILFSDKETAIAECILMEIPRIKRLIEDIRNDTKIKDKYTLGMKTINPDVFSHIINLVKKSMDGINNFDQIQVEYIETIHPTLLIEFIHTTNLFELHELKKIASTRFKRLINNDIVSIRKSFHLNNDFTEKEYENIKEDHKWDELI